MIVNEVCNVYILEAELKELSHKIVMRKISHALWQTPCTSTGDSVKLIQCCICMVIRPTFKIIGYIVHLSMVTGGYYFPYTDRKL